MTAKRYWYLILILCYQTMYPGHDIIVDLDGIIISPSSAAAVGSIGYGNLISAWWSGKVDVTNLRQRFFEVLKKIPSTNPDAEQKKGKAFWHDQEAPEVINDFLLGTTPCATLLAHVKSHIEKQKIDATEKNLMLQLAEVTFDPQKNSSIMYPVNDGIKLLQKLRDHGNTLHLVVNWNNDAWIELKKRHGKLLDTLINGKTILSSHHQQLKGPELYAHLFKQLNKTEKPCIALETGQQYHEDLKNCALEHGHTFKAVLCSDQNFVKADKRLAQLGAFPEKKITLARAQSPNRIHSALPAKTIQCAAN